MYKRVLIALDLEGVNHVVGEPYMGLVRGTAQWEIARRQAVLEVNAAAAALFEAGAEQVGLWDNHGGGNNIDASALDGRITLIPDDPALPRMRFADGKYDCICYFGYHAMEGTLGGVLAHTMNSKAVQFYKLNGKYIGEVDMDAYIAAEMGMPSRFFAGGDIACAQAKRAVEQIVTVVTKRELSRNEAVFCDDERLFSRIGRGIVEAVSVETEPCRLAFPAVLEKSFKRTEDAASYLAQLKALGIDAAHPEEEILGRDAHTVAAAIHTIEEMILCI